MNIMSRSLTIAPLITMISSPFSIPIVEQKADVLCLDLDSCFDGCEIDGRSEAASFFDQLTVGHGHAPVLDPGHVAAELVLLLAVLDELGLYGEAPHDVEAAAV